MFGRPLRAIGSISRLTYLLTVVLALACTDAVGDEKQTSPLSTSIVIGYDRFGQHGDLPESRFGDLSGALLVSELNCVVCHQADDSWLEPKRGPRLDGAGIRLQSHWIESYLRDPQAVKPGTTMPDVLGGLGEVEKADAINALVAFLSSQDKPFVEPKAGGALPVIHQFWTHGDSNRGRELYHTVGCVACHDPDQEYETSEAAPSAIDDLLKNLDADELADLGLASAARRVTSIPHSDLPTKYSARSLTKLLLNPASTRPDARMPSLRLSPAEAADIAAYLLDQSEFADAPIEINASEADAELVSKGAILFAQYNCTGCHDVSGDQDEKPSEQQSKLTLASIDIRAKHSCIDNAMGSMPIYRLNLSQRDTLKAFLGREMAKPHAHRRQHSSEEDTTFRMLQLNCFGCHQRSELGGVGRYRKPYFETVGQVDLGDEGRLPPSLDGIGKKLHSNAIAKVFHPKTSAHRAFMKARMPAYGDKIVRPLIESLPEADQADRSGEAKVFSSKHELRQMIEAGRELVNTGCVQCHVFQGESLPGVVGVDLQGITSRVHPAWFAAFVRNPGAVKKRTRMPTFFPNGTSNRTDILDGDVDQQVAAIWAYLKDLPNQSLPKAIADVRSANFELTPTDRPIVLRTFMKEAGTHAIAVGFPEGVHYAFDAERLRFAVAWKGRFLDAQGTWYERFTPPADPLGESVVVFDEEGLLSEQIRQKPTFQGYRLSGNGIPSMIYGNNQVTIEDQLKPIDNAGFRRTISLSPQTDGVTVELRFLDGKNFESVTANEVANEHGMTARLITPKELRHWIDQQDTQSTWKARLTLQSKQTLVLEYRW
ncbi:c-type cytochrome [Roseiconus lacunae]|uniref:c-type cytochrome n=1 Tax=Roseiconus lacunae TaxID=2605694 RepID=UPI001E2E9241|nr:c-type cytochrome [Roseiconus lacunae]MCD0462221.1 c-type cytochrome [Roseiconus lacunae]